MNNPVGHNGDESKLEKLEQDVNHLIKQAKAHELDLNQVKSLLERVQFDTGSTYEGVDSLERRYSEVIKRLRSIAEIQASHGEQFDTLKHELHTLSDHWLNELQSNFSELRSDIQTAQGTSNERFDQVATKDDIKNMATKDDVGGINNRLDKQGEKVDQMFQILQKLQEKLGG